MTDTPSQAIASAKAALAAAETAVQTNVITPIASSRWASSRLFFAVIGLAAIIVLHRMGIDMKIIDWVGIITLGFLFTRSMTDLGTAFANSLIECTRLKYNRQVVMDDGQKFIIIPSTTSAAPILVAVPHTPGTQNLSGAPTP